MSDSSFDDDDDALLLQLVEATQRPPQPLQPQKQPQNPLETEDKSEFQLQLYRAHGEISILRAQLESLRTQRSEEIAKLSKEAQNIKVSAQEHVTLLKQTVDKLEDEKKFLGNEIRSLSSAKRRKLADNYSPVVQDRVPLQAANGSGHPKQQPSSHFPRLTLQDDWSQFCHHLWHYTINGADRTLMAFLSKTCTEREISASTDLCLPANTPILACLWEMLLKLKHLRLDKLVHQVCELVLSVIFELLRLYEDRVPGVLVSVPFLISVIHATLNFKASAISESLVETVIGKFCQILKKLVFVLVQLIDEEDETFDGHSTVPYQQRLVENFTLVLSVDVLETAAVVATQFGPEFSRKLWDLGTFDVALMQQILPENTERFISSVQINLVSSFVEILYASINEDFFCTSDDVLNRLIVKSLLKVFIIDIRVKEDFMFYGLNRVLGNNQDLDKISQVVPLNPEGVFNKMLVSTPYPIKMKDANASEKFNLTFQHDCHLLTLRVRILTLLEAIVVSNKLDLLSLKENMKSIVRIIGYEQNHLIHQPRSQFIHMRLNIIGVLVRVLYYMFEEKNNTLIYPETLYEIFVVLMKIAFASDSLSVQAHDLLSRVRAKGITDLAVFNKSCEFRSREMAHFDLYSTNASKVGDLAGIEGDFANGLEFPFEVETIEIAREILSVCVNHDEADNLYYNMNRETQ